MSLSIKDLGAGTLGEVHQRSQTRRCGHGKVARFANFGAFIELDDNLEGLCHISELSEERVAKPEDVVQLGQEMDFKILRIDPETKKIGLLRERSARTNRLSTRRFTRPRRVLHGLLGELADFGLKAESNDE